MNGFPLPSMFSTTPDYSEFVLADRDPSEGLSILFGIEFESGNKISVAPTTNVSQRVGIQFPSYKDLLYGRLWLTPSVIDLGILARESDYNLYLWNAYDTDVNLLSITDVGDVSGITIDATLPLLINANEEVSFVMTAAASGAMVIDGSKLFNVDGYYLGVLASGLLIEGMRAVVLSYLHNWDKEFEIEYGFRTLIPQTKKFCEQRAQVFHQCRRSAKIELLEKGDRFYKLINLIKFGRANAWLIPIYSEVITLNMTESLLGVTSLDTNQDIDTFWNLQQYDFQLMLYKESTNEAEILEIDSRGDHNLVLVEGIKNAWDAEDVILFTAMNSMIKSYKIVPITNQISKVSLDMEEFIG